MKMTPEQACTEKQEEEEQRLSVCVRKTGLKGRTGSVFVLFRFWFRHVWLNDLSIGACHGVAYDVAPVKKHFSGFKGDDVGLVLSAPAADEQEWMCEWRNGGHDGIFCVEKKCEYIILKYTGELSFTVSDGGGP